MKHFGTIYFIAITILSSILVETRCSNVLTEISYGELIDKITILTIKSHKIANPEKLNNIKTELASLQKTFDEYIGNRADIAALQIELQKINEFFWDVQENIRVQESNKNFNDEFIQLARSVYFTNDERTALKRKINKLLESHIIEKKSHEIKCGKVDAETAYGELIDKIIILNLKLHTINSLEESNNIKTEPALLRRVVNEYIGTNTTELQTQLIVLQKILDEHIGDRTDIATLQAELEKVDRFLLSFEVDIRIQEHNKDFGDTFIQLARNIYSFNDERAAIKRKINVLVGSHIIEEKSY